MGEGLGLGESVSMALGGMIGGGIYAVLGVVAGAAGRAAWLAFAAAGVVALCAGYAYLALNDLSARRGGSVAFIETLTGNATLAGMTGWTLLVGYVGSMAMYAFAFGSYAVDLLGVAAVGGVPARPLLSVVVVAAFVALNLVGVREAGVVEDALVAAKVAILVVFAGVGLAIAVPQGLVRPGFGAAGGSSPMPALGVVGAAAASFVAFQGWQLLFYDQDSMADPDWTLPRAVFLSIPTAVGIYVAVALVTMAFVPELVRERPETALAVAAGSFLGSPGRAVIGLSALVSTASAINATLFSSSLFARGLVGAGMLPGRVAELPDGGTAPTARTLLPIGLVTAGATVLGSLQGITTFASVSFIVVFGAMCLLALRRHDEGEFSAVPPAVGFGGCAVFLPLLLYRLATREPRVFESVVLIAAVVVAVEVLYFERHAIRDGLRLDRYRT